jgi:hypothetical protein
MAASFSAPSLSAHEQSLIELTEVAIRDGLQLERWFRKNELGGTLKLFPLNLQRTYNLPNTAEGFFDSLPINGKSTSVMGCVQFCEFGKADSLSTEERLADFVLGNFLPKANWVYPDGFNGGFGLEQSLYKTSDGNFGKFAEPECKGCVDWRDLGKKYDWVLLTVRIYDFVMKFGPFTRRLPEAAAVVPHADFVHVEDQLPKDCVYGITIGYPFIAFAPIPNNFGFGPGKFGTAIKTYTFYLTKKKEVRVKMYFAAAPRCAKVFDFGKSIPDPVYGSSDLLGKISLGLWNSKRFRERLDSFMLCQHSRVHQALMEGSSKCWDQWSRGGGS